MIISLPALPALLFNGSTNIHFLFSPIFSKYFSGRAVESTATTTKRRTAIIIIIPIIIISTSTLERVVAVKQTLPRVTVGAQKPRGRLQLSLPGLFPLAILCLDRLGHSAGHQLV